MFSATKREYFLLHFRIEEAKRAIKRSAPPSSTDNDRYGDIERKRSANDRRFEPPPPPRFDTAIRSSTYDRPPEKKRIDDYPSGSSKRNDDYKTSTRGNGTSSMGTSADVSSFKRPLNDYPKRGSDLELPSRSSGSNSGYDQRGAPSLSSTKDHRFNDSLDSRSSGSNFGRSRVDERDLRFVCLHENCKNNFKKCHVVVSCHTYRSTSNHLPRISWLKHDV